MPIQNIFSFEGVQPIIHPTAYIHPMACVIGQVSIGKDVYIGPGAVLRGDFGGIEIMDGCNIQENCIIHMFPGITVTLQESAHIGHGAIVHGANIGKNCLIGMNAVIMDNVSIGDECIVGALCFIKADSIIPPRSVVVGNPHKIIREVSDEMLAWKTEGTEIYQRLPARNRETLKACVPLTEKPENWGRDIKYYTTWNERKNQSSQD